MPVAEKLQPILHVLGRTGMIKFKETAHDYASFQLIGNNNPGVVAILSQVLSMQFPIASIILIL
jgi:hypothetical protein